MADGRRGRPPLTRIQCHPAPPRRQKTIAASHERAVREAGIAKPATPKTLRHSFATHVLQAGYDVRTVQKLLGHTHVETTMIRAHVLNRGARDVVRPLD